MSGRAILVWQQVADPLPKHMSRLYSALSQLGLDVLQRHPGVVLLAQSWEQVRRMPLDHTGWTLSQEVENDG